MEISYEAFILIYNAMLTLGTFGLLLGLAMLWDSYKRKPYRKDRMFQGEL